MEYISLLLSTCILAGCLLETDPDMFEIIKKEDHRQRSGLEMIASENFTSRGVIECLGSCLTNKYSEGKIDNRYYGGNQVCTGYVYTVLS